MLSISLWNSGVPTIDQIYRDNLALLIKEAETQDAFAAKIGKSPSQVSQWLNAAKDFKSKKPRAMSARSARQIEEKCGKPRGWMDQPHHEPSGVAEAPPPYLALPLEYLQAIENLRVLGQSQRSSFLDQLHQAAELAREIRADERRKDPEQGKVAAARRSHTTRRATTSMKWGDGNRQQTSLPLLVPTRDPFTAAPSDREAKFYERVEHAPKAADHEN